MCELTGLWEFLHCICILNHHVVHFKYITICQLYLNKAEKILWYILTINYFSAIIKNELLILTKIWMNLKEIILSKNSNGKFIYIAFFKNNNYRDGI